MQIPDRFESKLKQGDQLFLGIATRTIAEFGEILEDNKLYFFEEYTDHGIRHIERVLASSDDLITGNTYNTLLTGKDIGFYILAVLLHDIAMHLQLDGFKHLIDGGLDHIRVAEFDKHTWKELWDDYLSEAKKFNARQLVAVFGEEEVVVHVPDLSQKGSITNNDKKLIGEFIRRHHPRLAHEIALHGFPFGAKLLSFAEGLDPKHKDLIGVIARSHGMDLRTAIVYIEDNFGRKNKRYPLGVHAVYLMVLLRISDYIQIDSSRIFPTLVKLKTFASPVSAAEHQSHLSIDHIDTKFQDDPERIHVSASPKDSNAFLKLKQLIKDIQHELDISWAVLGEHYGKDEKPEIKYRRIISNLEEEIFASRQDYVADAFSFKASDEIIQLMIAPLYGDNASFGVRELLQNALDACKEREVIENGKGNADYKAVVRVEVYPGDGGMVFTIRDNGIGMNADIIKQYFLKAGASYRKSTEWRHKFIDKDGHTTVRRSGRFGVGLLAAFLIGDNIHVETRKADEPFGYKFDTGLNTTQINLTKDSAIAQGTFISIEIKRSKEDEFNEYDTNTPYYNGEIPNWYEWYVLGHPVVEYVYRGEKFKPFPKPDPDLANDLPIDWMGIDAAGFNKIHWTYSKDYTNAELACNGIIIPEDHHQSIAYLPDINVIPRISVFDNEGNLPITLDRSKITAQFPFRRELVEDIFRDFMACVLMFNSTSIVRGDSIECFSESFNHPAFLPPQGRTHPSYNMNGLNTVLVCEKGFMINAQYCIDKHGPVNILCIQHEGFEPGYRLNIDLNKGFLQLIEKGGDSVMHYNNIISATPLQYYSEDDEEEWNWEKEEGESPEEENGENEQDNDEQPLKGEPSFRNIHCQVYMKKEKYAFLFKTDKKRIEAWMKKAHKLLHETEEWACFQLGNVKYTNGHFTNELLEAHKDTIDLVKEYELSKSSNIRILNELLARYLGEDVIIPYDLEERKRKYPLAFEELARYMEKYK